MARLPGLVPLVAVVAVFVLGPARIYLPRLPNAWALYRMDRSSPLPLKAEKEEVLALCRSMQPDAVVVANGGQVVVPTIPGSDLPHVQTAQALRERYLIHVWDTAPSGNPVLRIMCSFDTSDAQIHALLECARRA